MENTHPAELSDEEVARLVQTGDKEVFGVLMERYEAKLSRYGTRFLSDPENIVDIVQDIFIRTYKNIQSFDTSQKFSSWIYRIAHNTFINSMKRGMLSPFVFVDFDTLLLYHGGGDSIELERNQKEMREMIDKGLSLISTHYREIIILYYLEELSYKEIADILHVPIGTVAVRLKRARDSLKKACEKLGIHYEH